MFKNLMSFKKLILITIIPVLLLTGYLLLATNILAADDNANEVNCSDQLDDCDFIPNSCSNYGFTYTTSNKIFFITA